MAPSTLNSPRVLLLGESSAAEWAAIQSWLAEQVAESNLHHVSHLREVRRIKDEAAWWPDLIVVLQSWPDQYSGVDAHALFAWFPLARVIVCHGPWCESDGRTRTQWPLAVRVPVSLAAARLCSEWEFLSGRDSTHEPPPLTANRGDLFGHRCAVDRLVHLDGLRVFVDSVDREWVAVWERIISTAAGQVVDNATQAERILFDVDPRPRRRERLATLAAQKGPDTILALTGFRHRPAESEIAPLLCGALVDKLAPQGEVLARLAARHAGMQSNSAFRG